MTTLQNATERPLITTIHAWMQSEAVQETWSVVRHELMYISWALMEMALIVPFVLSLMGWARYWPAQLIFLWSFVLYLLPLNLVRFMTASGIRRRKQQNILLLILPFLIIITTGMMVHQRTNPLDASWILEFVANILAADNAIWGRDVVIILLTAFFWSRGISLMQRNFSVEGTGLFLRVGGLLVAPLLTWLANVRLSWSVTPYVLLFFGAGLLCIALVRADELEQKRSGQSAYLSPKWVSHILLVSFLIMFVSGTIAVIVSGDVAGTVFGIFQPLWTAVSFLTTITGLTLLYICLPLLELLAQLMEQVSLWLQPVMLAIDPQFDGFASSGDYLDGDILGLADLSEIPTWFNASAKIGILVVVLLIVFLMAVTVVRFYRLQVADNLGTTLHTPDDTGLMDSTWLERLRKRLGFWQDWRTAKTIRKIYERMVKLAQAQGFPRGEAETPYEYMPTLSRLWPEQTAEIRLITDAYVKVRYGELPETNTEFEAILGAWQVLEETAVYQLQTKNQKEN